MFVMRPARPGDREAFAELLLARCEWMELRGIPSWRPSADDLVAMCDNPYGDVWVMEDEDGRMVGRTTVQPQGAPWWTAAERAEPPFYLSTTVTHPGFRRWKPGTLIAWWAVNRAAEQGARWVRRDCLEPGLLRYYRSQGFTLVREVEWKRHRRYLLQRRAERLDLPQVRTEPR